MTKTVTRADAVRAFQAAFDEWERRYAEARITGAISDRGAYFASLLDELDLAAGRSWCGRDELQADLFRQKTEAN